MNTNNTDTMETTQKKPTKHFKKTLDRDDIIYRHKANKPKRYNKRG